MSDFISFKQREQDFHQRQVIQLREDNFSIAEFFTFYRLLLAVEQRQRFSDKKVRILLCSIDIQSIQL